jgi:hypothetical protein
MNHTYTALLKATIAWHQNFLFTIFINVGHANMKWSELTTYNCMKLFVYTELICE